MSYILDALRRAEAERQRGAVPGLHGQATAIGVLDAQPSAQRRLGALVWGGLGLAVGAVVLGGGLWWRDANQAASSRIGESTAALPPLPPPAALPAARPIPQNPAPIPPRPPGPVQAGLPVGAPPLAPEPLAVAVPKPRATLPVAPPVVTTLPAPALPTVSPAQAPPNLAPPNLPPPPGVPAPATAAKLPTLADLPEALRRELPALAVGGAVYAEQPSQRIVILNGQVFHEGDRVASELLVQQIRLKSVVLAWRGQRFELPL